MRIYSNDELKTQAEEVFKTFPEAEKAHVTSDGTAFLDPDRANLYARVGKKTPLKVCTFENDNEQFRNQKQ